MLDIDLSNIPTSPGVYMFLGANDRILYVGKAKVLRSRLASYFNSSVKNIKTERMLYAARTVRTIVTTNEVEAFLLESNLIKTEQPKYNILLKDSKGYPYVKLTDEKYPKLIYTRNTNDKRATYFGPFVNSGELREMIEFLKELFPLRTCTNQQFNKGRVCLKYQIKRCLGPCEQFISQEGYSELVDEVRTFFNGETGKIKGSLKEHMERSSQRLDFEMAAFYRDRLKAVDKLFAKQQAVQINEKRSLDLFYRYESKHTASVTQMFVRGGWLIGATTHFFSHDENDLLERFIMQFYSNIRQFPDMVVAEGDKVSDTLEEWLTRVAEKKVILRKRGYADLITLAERNAKHATQSYMLKATQNKDLYPRLAKLAGREVRRIECIDISHLGGENTVGVSIVSDEGEFERKSYKRYRIKTASNNDVQAIRELMTRKLDNVLEGSEEQADLYLIDGGVSQLNVAFKVLREKGVDSACLSISEGVKPRYNLEEGSMSVEEVHSFGRKNPHKFRKNDPLLLFLQKIRDEAHRSAVHFSRSISLKKVHTSPLLGVEGVGATRAKAILTAMPDLYSRRNLTPELLRSEAGIPLKVAEAVVKFVEDNK